MSKGMKAWNKKVTGKLIVLTAVIIASLVLVRMGSAASGSLPFRFTRTTGRLPGISALTTPTNSDAVQQGVWKSHNDTGGGYSISRPEAYTELNGETLSVDGTKIPLKNGYSILSPQTASDQNSFIITVSFEKTGNGTSLERAVDGNGWCTYITNDRGEPYSLDSKPALIFRDTPCGPFGSTVIYSLNNNLVYLIKIETSKTYKGIEAQVNPILQTFKFGQ